MTLVSVAETTKKWAGLRKIPHTFWFVTTSTNEQAKKDILNEAELYQNFPFSGHSSLSLFSYFSSFFPPFKLYIAQHQTEGKGRHLRSWKDEGKGGELLISWTLLLSYLPQHMTSLLVGMILFQSLKRVWPLLSWSLKPPNDIYLEGRKIGGVLLESFSIFQNDSHSSMPNKDFLSRKQFCLIVGLGFNFFSFPPLERKATCLGQESFSLKKYFDFLDAFYEGLVYLSRNAFRTTLKEKERELLKAALVSYPHKKYLDLSLNGEISMEGSKISWREL